MLWHCPVLEVISCMKIALSEHLPPFLFHCAFVPCTILHSGCGGCILLSATVIGKMVPQNYAVLHLCFLFLTGWHDCSLGEWYQKRAPGSQKHKRTGPESAQATGNYESPEAGWLQIRSAPLQRWFREFFAGGTGTWGLCRPAECRGNSNLCGCGLWIQEGRRYSMPVGGGVLHCKLKKRLGHPIVVAYSCLESHPVHFVMSIHDTQLLTSTPHSQLSNWPMVSLSFVLTLALNSECTSVDAKSHLKHYIGADLFCGILWGRSTKKLRLDGTSWIASWRQRSRKSTTWGCPCPS